MKFSFKTPPKTKELSADKRAAREQMLRAMPDELLVHIRGGLQAGCHVNCTCCTGGII